MPWRRGVLAAVVVADLVTIFRGFDDARKVSFAEGAAFGWFVDLLSRPPAAAIVLFAGIAGAVAFARRPGRLWEGGLALGALILSNTAHTQLLGTPSRNFFYSGACLSGWMLGLAAARRRGAPEDESYALTGAVALLGAVYLNAGLSKLVFGGIGWVRGVSLQSLIIGLDNADPGFLGALHARILGSPAAIFFFSTAAVGLELSGPLMLAGPRVRRFVAFGLLVMHASIFLLTRIGYWEALVFLLAFVVFAGEPSPDAARRGSPPNRRAFLQTAGLLAACAVFAVFRQGYRSRHYQGRGPGESRGAASPAKP
jgi:hypothetical protein